MKGRKFAKSVIKCFLTGKKKSKFHACHRLPWVLVFPTVPPTSTDVELHAYSTFQIFVLPPLLALSSSSLIMYI